MEMFIVIDIYDSNNVTKLMLIAIIILVGFPSPYFENIIPALLQLLQLIIKNTIRFIQTESLQNFNSAHYNYDRLKMCLKISFLGGYIVNFPKCEPEWSFFLRQMAGEKFQSVMTHHFWILHCQSVTSGSLVLRRFLICSQHSSRRAPQGQIHSL